MELADQLEWEEQCSARGLHQHVNTQKNLRSSGRADNTEIASQLRQEYTQILADRIKANAYVSVGRHAKYNTMIRARILDHDYRKVAYITLQTMIQAVLGPEDGVKLVSIAVAIADRLEVDYKCLLFEAKHPSYFNKTLESFKDNRVTAYDHQKKVVMLKFNEFEYEWNDWTQEFKGAFGASCVGAVLQELPDIFKLAAMYKRGKRVNTIAPADGFQEWMTSFDTARGLMFPKYLPTKIKPVDWSDLDVGGYYSHNMKLSFVKTKGKEHKAFVRKGDLTAHFKAANKIQSTAWKVNKRVLEVQQYIYKHGLGIGIPDEQAKEPQGFPEHLKDIPKEELTPTQQLEVTDWKHYMKAHYRADNERKAQVIGFMQSYSLATELQDWDRFYFVHTADFRGRIYSVTTGLSPQGADTAKGVLHFAEGVPLGKQGAQWLAVHGANVYGKDKILYSERVDWIRDNERNIKACVDDPISNREFWSEADKPYQFLAFCFDWADTDYGRDQNANSYIPVGLDGSCNGLQHYSAMLRDNVGALATNLRPPKTATSTPEDIYQQVADRTAELLQEQVGEEFADLWLAVGLKRKCAKRPVMTLPYGSTQNSARDYIFEWVRDNWDLFGYTDDSKQYALATYLTPFMWKAIGQIVVAAREAMQWLRKHVPKGEFCSWLSPIGFPVYQYYKDLHGIRVDTYLLGRAELWVNDRNQIAGPKRSAQLTGVAPNFVHSIDATHLVMTTNLVDLPSYAMIHDDYGTHAGNTHLLFTAIRESFFDLYKNNDPLADWAKAVGVPDSKLLDKGYYNIADVKKAIYFFG